MTCTSIGEKISLIESIFGRGNVDKKIANIAVSCPICNSTGRDTRTKKKLVIRLDNDICHCWVCGWKSRTVLPLIKKFGSHKHFELYRKYTSSCMKLDDDFVEVEKKLSLPNDFTLITLLHDERRKEVLNYLASRNIDWSDVDFWHLGVSNEDIYKNRIIIPSFDRFGKLNFIVSRSYNKKQRRNYHNCDVERSSVVFNEFNIDWSEPVIICEGPFDMFKCGKNSIPLLGCNLSEDSATFNSLIVNMPTVVIALDSDMKDKTIKIASVLSSYEFDVRIVDVENDPGEMTKEGFKELFLTAKNWSWRQKFDRKIDSIFL